MTRHGYAGNTAIVGIGATEFSKSSGRSELQLALEACSAACADAGLEPHRVNGLSTFTMETNPENPNRPGRVYVDPMGEKLASGLIKAPKISYGRVNQLYG